MVTVLLFEQVPGWRFFRSVYYLPTILSAAVVGTLMRIMFTTQGAVNDVLGRAGLEQLQHDWLGTVSTAFMVLIFAFYWQTLGQGVLIFLAGMSAIPADLIEAARLDGAGWWNRLTRIIIPLLVPTIAYFVLINVIWIFVGLFALVYTVTEGRPGLRDDAVRSDDLPQGVRVGRDGLCLGALRHSLPHRARHFGGPVADIRPVDDRCLSRWPRHSLACARAHRRTQRRCWCDPTGDRARPLADCRDRDLPDRLHGSEQLPHVPRIPCQTRSACRPDSPTSTTSWRCTTGSICLRLFLNTVTYIALASAITLGGGGAGVVHIRQDALPGAGRAARGDDRHADHAAGNLSRSQLRDDGEPGADRHLAPVVLLWSATSVPGSIFLLSSLMRAIPSEILEAARIDGAGYLETLLRIALPLSVPGSSPS